MKTTSNEAGFEIKDTPTHKDRELKPQNHEETPAQQMLADCYKKLQQTALKKITFNHGANEIAHMGSSLKISTLEANILEALIETPNGTVSKDQLCKRAWGYTEVSAHIFHVSIFKLRRKLEKISLEIQCTPIGFFRLVNTKMK